MHNIYPMILGAMLLLSQHLACREDDIKIILRKSTSPWAKTLPKTLDGWRPSYEAILPSLVNPFSVHSRNIFYFFKV